MACTCECREMSPVRRTFCLLTLFDLLVSFLLWLIYTQLKGLSAVDAFVSEVVRYGIYTSLFDLVMLAAVRFIVLILAYGLFRLQNASVVAVTTAVSSGFLIAKVFLFTFVSRSPDGHVEQGPVLSYVLLISSFVLSWAQTWFVDFKVIPREMKDKLEELKRSASEISPLLYGGRRNYETSGPASAFYSPLGGSPPSENVSAAGDAAEALPRNKSVLTDAAYPSPLGVAEKDRLVQRARGALDIVNDLLVQSGWKFQTSGKEGSDVYSFKDRRFGKLFKIEGILRVSTDELFTDFYLRVRDLPAWNPNIAFAERIDIIDEKTDVCYVCVKDQAGGLFSSRDFVDVRCYEKSTTGLLGNRYVLVSINCEHPRKPVAPEFVRGENGPNAWILEPLPLTPDGLPRTLFISILNTDLKGWLPQTVVDQALSTVLIDLLKSLQIKYRN